VDSELVDGFGVMQTNCFRALVVGLGLLVSASCGADPAKPDSGSNAPGLRAIAIGEKVPDFSFVNTGDGKTYRLSDLQKDKKSNSSGVVVLNFWCSFCGSCRHVEHALNKLASTYKGRVAVIAIDASAGETIEGIRAFKQEKKLTLPVVFDSTGHTADLLGTKVTTTTVVIDAKGVLRYRGQFQVRASGSKSGRGTGGSFLSRFDVSKFDANSDGQITRSEIKSKLHQRVYDRMVKQFKLDSTKSYQLTEFRKAIGQTPKGPSASGKSLAGGKKLTATTDKKASADPQAVIALKAVLAGKNVKVTETALRG
tara:strand:- start:62 stop:994 length:933 start_codon:yes stop_codon:yes gene_type:complete